MQPKKVRRAEQEGRKARNRRKRALEKALGLKASVLNAPKKRPVPPTEVSPFGKMLREVYFVREEPSYDSDGNERDAYGDPEELEEDDEESEQQAAPVASALLGHACTSWLLDTGASDHVVGSEALLRVTAPSSGVLQTAAGPVPGGEVGLVQTPLGVVSGARQMPGSPNLLSLGVLAMKRGYGFRWDPFQRPVLVHPGGREEELRLENRVPVIGAAATEWPRNREGELILTDDNIDDYVGSFLEEGLSAVFDGFLGEIFDSMASDELLALVAEAEGGVPAPSSSSSSTSFNKFLHLVRKQEEQEQE
ncbi:MAG: hypothetical protein VYC81_01075 [Actinomycetota bacterium]|nr:hypothetical protein [Actinomycetota bacterium]